MANIVRTRLQAVEKVKIGNGIVAQSLEFHNDLVKPKLVGEEILKHSAGANSGYRCEKD